MIEGLLSSSGGVRLAEALTERGFTCAGITARVGEGPTLALNRYDPEPALAVLADDPLGALIRLFLYARPLPVAEAEHALSPFPLAEALGAGLLARHGEDEVRATVHVHPYGEGWTVSDFPLFLQTSRHGSEYVLPPGPSGVRLERATVPHPVGTALDLGTGCGIQALRLSARARQVTATDLSARALRLAATTAALGGCDWELLRGDMVRPVAGRRFDLVVSNLPYSVGPGTVDYMHRDSGRPGDRIGAELAEAAPGLLTEGGFLQFQAQWAHVRGEDWRERVASWVRGSGIDAWIVQSSVAPPAPYVDGWLRETREEGDREKRAAWLEWLEARRIEGIGYGTVAIRNSGRHDSVVRVEELSPEAGDLLGAEVAGWFARQDWLRDHDPLAARYLAAPGLTLWQQGEHGGRDGWQVRRQVLKMPIGGLNWTEEASPLAVRLLDDCDGARTLREQLRLLSGDLDMDPAELARTVLPQVSHLVERGAMVPAELVGRMD